jgi:pimeloyl-ACP methyl ester carboxylesterase
MMAAAQRARGQVPGPTVAAMRAEGFAGWPYVLDVPEDYRGDEPRPLLIVLGGGAGVAIRTAATIHPAVAHEGWLVVSPHAAGLWWDGRAPEMVKALLAELLRDLNVDTDRVYVAGSSNGGAGAVLFPALMPDRFAAAAPLMAVGLEPMGDRFPSVAGLGHIPWMFVHGADDMPSRSQSIVDGLKRADPRARAELHVLTGRGHDIRIGTDDGWTLPFLEKQVRERFPRQVRIRSREPVRVFWAEVIEKEGGLAEADGTIEGGVVTLTTHRVRSLRVRLRREYLGDAAAVRIVVKGREAYAGPFSEDCRLMAESWRATGDPHLAHSWEHTIDGLK